MYMANYTSDNFNANKGKSDLVVIPIGSLEAHGHHLPLGTDIFSPRLFCQKLEEKIGDRIWIAPQIPYGQSYDLTIYPGTINVPSQVFAEYVYWVGKGMYENGMKKAHFAEWAWWKQYRPEFSSRKAGADWYGCYGDELVAGLFKRNSSHHRCTRACR